MESSEAALVWLARWLVSIGDAVWYVGGHQACGSVVLGAAV